MSGDQMDLFRPSAGTGGMTGEVDLVYLDPPWNADNGGGGRGAQEQYETTGVRNILRVVQSATWPSGERVYVPAADAHMRMWCTTLSLLDALWLMDSLRFKYSTMDVWVKHGSWGATQDRVVAHLRDAVEHFTFVRDKLPSNWTCVRARADAGLDTVASALSLLGDPGEARDVGQMACGQYRRSAHEILLYGTRGRLARGPGATRTTSLVGGRVIPVPRRRGGGGTRIHSRKPAEVWEHVEATSPYQRRIAMFERGTERPGWRFWGDEVGKFGAT